MTKLDSIIEEDKSAVKPNKIVTTMAERSDSGHHSFIQSKTSVYGTSADETKDTFQVPIHQDSMLYPRVIRELSKDSSNSFRTVNLDTEYDKLLHLLE